MKSDAPLHYCNKFYSSLEMKIFTFIFRYYVLSAVVCLTNDVGLCWLGKTLGKRFTCFKCVIRAEQTIFIYNNCLLILCKFFLIKIMGNANNCVKASGNIKNGTSKGVCGRS